MSREAQNDAFARTSFLNGVNAAYVEEMQALYERNPGAVNDEWRLFFQSLQDEKSAAARDGNDGPSWGRPLNELNSTSNPDLLSALTGDYGSAERAIQSKIKSRASTVGHELNVAASLRATQDSIRATC